MYWLSHTLHFVSGGISMSFTYHGWIMCFFFLRGLVSLTSCGVVSGVSSLTEVMMCGVFELDAFDCGGSWFGCTGCCSVFIWVFSVAFDAVVVVDCCCSCISLVDSISTCCRLSNAKESGVGFSSSWRPCPAEILVSRETSDASWPTSGRVPPSVV